MVITQTRPAGPDGFDASRAPRSRRAALPIAIGMVAMLVDGIGAGIPSYWGDEAASVLSGTRPLPSLLNELGSVDAVHGVYYMLLHVWISVFGTGEWATRALSVIAIGALASGVVALGRMWFGRTTAVVAGLLVAAIPRASSLAIEARGYAITAATVVWLVVLFTRLAHHGAARRRWVLFGVLAGVCSWFFLYLLLVPLSLCAVVLLLPKWAEAPHVPPHRVRGDMLTTMGSAFLAALPILALAAAQRGQVSFLADRGYLSARGVLITPWFSHGAAALARPHLDCKCAS